MSFKRFERCLHLDFEGFSEADLPKVGASVYSRDPSTEVIMGAYTFETRPDLTEKDIKQWDALDRFEDIPDEVKYALDDPKCAKMAWNASFEQTILMNTLGIEVRYDEWIDPMIQCMYLSMPGKLEKAGEIVGLPEEQLKMDGGKALITKFSKPRKPTKARPDWVRNFPHDYPEDWEKFLLYNRVDVVAEVAIWCRTKKWLMPYQEWRHWYLDREINDLGIPVNVNMAANAMRMYEEYKAECLDEMREITGLDNPNSGKQLLPWLQEGGYVFDDLKKPHVVASIEEERICPEDPDVVRTLELRREAAQTSPTKFAAVERGSDADGFMRQTLQFYGAQRTGRWGGRRFQPQNLKNPGPFEDAAEAMAYAIEHGDLDTLKVMFGDPMDAISRSVRAAVQAPPGYLIFDADLNAIENRVLGWMAQEDGILDVFKNGLDPYIAFAVHLTGMSYEDLWHEYKVLKKKQNRTEAKPGVLGCGYMLSAGKQFRDPKSGEIEATGLLGYAKNMGIDLTPEMSEKSVRIWRQAHPNVQSYWWEIQQAAWDTLVTGKPHAAGPVEFDISLPFLRMRLPSGRHLYYYKAHIAKRMKPWGEKDWGIVYYGVNDKGNWGLIDTHPGKLTENADQAISRDILQHGISLAKAEGLDVRLHVHDQISGLTPEDDAERQLELLRECMSQTPAWAPGLPLAAGGAVSRVFWKD